MTLLNAEEKLSEAHLNMMEQLTKAGVIAEKAITAVSQADQIQGVFIIIPIPCIHTFIHTCIHTYIHTSSYDILKAHMSKKTQRGFGGDMAL